MKQILKSTIYLFLGLVALFSGITGCDDRIDDPNSSEAGRDLITVSLNFGFAEELIGELYRNGSPQRLAATARRNGSPQRLALKAVTPPSTRADCPI